jgi:hypothetical protein
LPSINDRYAAYLRGPQHHQVPALRLGTGGGAGQLGLLDVIPRQHEGRDRAVRQRGGASNRSQVPVVLSQVASSGPAMMPR